MFDMRSRRIPNWLTAGAFVIGLVIAHSQGTLFFAVVAALFMMMVLGIPNLFKSKAIGAGDVKLAGAVGALLGTTNALCVVAAACGAFAAISTFRRPRCARYRPKIFPFAPFVLAGYPLAAWLRFWSN
ncbi:MAG: prepilin peptidase [Chloroflexi bacterium]|nr:prepilin peptidase [Chloroflexota bacterium]MYC47080.1 prepilin peptidase [Chloroflexota bacterium]